MLKWILLGDEEAGHAAANRLVFFFFFFGKVVSVTNGIFKSLFSNTPNTQNACSVSLCLDVQVLKAALLFCFLETNLLADQYLETQKSQSCLIETI